MGKSETRHFGNHYYSSCGEKSYDTRGWRLGNGDVVEFLFVGCSWMAHDKRCHSEPEG